ncbi:hypothetical protein GBO93_00315 [Pediococcus acidilactici]|nr:hypothetical protein GBO20_00315 [Pediococcus acidilactici]KAF0338325.1 hypothetical protein GBO39_02050 [Pediococcus acidilactici]KAF0339621.1 hypothetical protein GBO40_05115 [Pediococcus acidilactici]KAF0345954.1 hypothetical protein GBO43_01900 [Pediococcus acidilactici]KAF0350246.1 hypothetical protein GBO45_02050 [Pediococcus acidilactici]
MKKLFWFFDFNRSKSQFVPLNQKLTIMPKSGIMVNFQLMLANYPTFVPLSFWELTSFSAYQQIH